MPRRMRGAKTQVLAVLRRCSGTATCGSDPGRYADTTSSLLFVPGPAQGGGAKLSGAVIASWKKMLRREKKCHYKVANRREKKCHQKMKEFCSCFVVQKFHDQNKIFTTNFGLQIVCKSEQPIHLHFKDSWKKCFTVRFSMVKKSVICKGWPRVKKMSLKKWKELLLNSMTFFFTGLMTLFFTSYFATLKTFFFTTKIRCENTFFHQCNFAVWAQSPLNACSGKRGLAEETRRTLEPPPDTLPNAGKDVGGVEKK